MKAQNALLTFVGLMSLVFTFLFHTPIGDIPSIFLVVLGLVLIVGAFVREFRGRR